ncbi:MAG TPA: hypothetical protein VFP33_05025 [Gallionella sp.]|nr:hypothetical protein [Gallionella sp.]
MIIAAALPDTTQPSRHRLAEALLAYERRFGYPPDWLDDAPQGRALSLIKQALERGAPLAAADHFH